MAIQTINISGAGVTSQHITNSNGTALADGTYFYDDQFSIGAHVYSLSVASDALVTVGGCPFPSPGQTITIMFGDSAASLQSLNVDLESCAAGQMTETFTNTFSLLGNTTLNNGAIMTVTASSAGGVVNDGNDIRILSNSSQVGNVSVDFNAAVDEAVLRLESINGFSESVFITPIVPAANVTADTGITYNDVTGELVNTSAAQSGNNNHGATVLFENPLNIDVLHNSTETPPDVDAFRFVNIEVTSSVGPSTEPILSNLVATGSTDGSGDWSASVSSSVSEDVYAIIVPSGTAKQDPCDIIMQSVFTPAGADTGLSLDFSGNLPEGDYEIQVTPDSICSQVVTCEPFSIEIPTVVPVWTTTGSITSDGTGTIVFICKVDNGASVDSYTQSGAPSGTVLTEISDECVQVSIPQQSADFSFSLFANGDGFNVEKPVDVVVEDAPTGAIQLMCDPTSLQISLQGAITPPTVTALDQFGNPIASTFDSSGVNVNQVGDYLATVSATANGETVTKNFPVTVTAQLYYGCPIAIQKGSCAAAKSFCIYENEVDDIVLDWTLDLDGATITSNQWAALDGGATILIEELNGSMSGVRIGNGVASPDTYSFVNTITDSFGRTTKCIVELEVKACP